MAGVCAVVNYRLGHQPHTLRLLEPDRPVAAHGLQAVWRWQRTEDGHRVWVELANVADGPLYIQTADVLTTSTLDMGVPPQTWSVYQNGWQSWSPTLARHLDNGLYTDPATPEYRAAHQPHWEPGYEEWVSSEWITVVASRAPSPRSKALLAGFVTCKDQMSEIRLRTDGSGLIARCHFDGALLPQGRLARSEVLLLASAPDPLGLLERWAEATGLEMRARVPLRPPTGWCTWYYFYGENTAEDVLQNLRAIARQSLPLEVILLDDGYQTAIGDWFSLRTDRFPDGLEAVAQAARQAGHRLGIWTAPFGVAATSRLFAAHPHWVLREDTGEPVVGWTHWGTDCYALDCTHPEVLAWLQDTFRRMRSQWGVEFFKIDFLFAAARPGLRHDASATSAQALRRGLEAIRAAIGDDALLLGCGAPLGPCVGLVDGMRVGPDVDPNWHPIWRHDLSMPSTENALRNGIARAPFHGRLWANDPDCLLVRQRGADLDLVLNEMRTLAAVVALLGGLTLNSDHLPAIRPGRLKYLRQALPPTGVSARPLDLFQNEMPRLLVLPVERAWGRWWVVGCVNWEDRTTQTTLRLSELGLPEGRYHAYHYWRRRYLGVVEEAVTIRRHQPHETVVLLLKPVCDRPDLLTTTFHVCQGAIEVAEVGWQEGSLWVRLEKEGRQFGEVLVAVPEGWRAATARVDGTRRELRPVAPGVVALGLTLQGRADIEVECEPV